MALQSHYKRYLDHPSADALAANATLHYTPTATTITGSKAILKHVITQDQEIKRQDNFLDVIEGPGSICIETETTLEFVAGGGVFLPGLDENFLIDKSVTLPMIHVVAFDKEQKIQQIRLLWDQGCLLKSVDIIGSRGKNWPISDGRDQMRALNKIHDSSLAAAVEGASLKDAAPAERRDSRARGANADKYTSLPNTLFASRSAQKDEPAEPPTAQRGGARPPTRDYHDLFAAGADLPDEPPPKVSGLRATARPPPRDYHDLFAAGADLPEDVRPSSPTKGNPLKMGAGKTFHENRLFTEDTGAAEEQIMSPEKAGYKVHPKKYEHFEFGEEHGSVQPKKTKEQDKHQSRWDFSDFTTPSKVRSRAQPHQERHFGWSDDEEEAQKAPVHREYKPQARPDSKPQFEFKDEDTPRASARPGRPTSSKEDRMGLYEDNVVSGAREHTKVPVDAGPQASEKMPLGNITNKPNTTPATDNARPLSSKGISKGHAKNFSSQFDIHDADDSELAAIKNENENTRQRAPAALKKVARTMQANWQMYDEDEEARNKPRGINIQGDGMGSRKTTEKPWWDFEA